VNCLVTGASGFIGSWLVRKLVFEGHKVRVLCRKSSVFNLIQDLNFEKAFGDITDPSSIEPALKNIDTVFHLAGYIGYKKADHDLMDRINVKGTENLYRLSLLNNVKNFIFLSSVTAIGASLSPFEKMDEESVYNLSKFNFGYAESKRKAEKIVLSSNSSMKCVSLNPSTVYGPGDMLKSSRKNQLLAMQGNLKFYPYGGVSVVGIHDVVDAIYKSVDLGEHGERYILSGDNLFIKDLMDKICFQAKSKPPRYQIPGFILDTMGFIGDHFTNGKPLDSETANVIQLFHWYKNTKAIDKLEFKPSPSDQVIKSSVDWAMNNILNK
jgi:dihydroflavonol-4-reductase